MTRWLKYRSILLRRRHPRSENSWLSRLLNSELVAWTEGTASRGIAVGMFWAFIPMPFQMFPAALFCWMVRGNLPIAILCVWLSNPITFPPILLAEHYIGEIIVRNYFELSTQIAGDEEDITEMSLFSSGLRNLMVGGLALALTSMLVSYVSILVAFRLSRRNYLRRLNRRRELIASGKLTGTDAGQVSGKT